MKHMEETVNEICESMANDPDRWEAKALTVKDLKTGIEYWHLSFKSAITDTFKPNADNVFSWEQGVRIKEAVDKMLNHKATVAQQEIINAMKKSSSKSWWEFWK